MIRTETCARPSGREFPLRALCRALAAPALLVPFVAYGQVGSPQGAPAEGAASAPAASSSSATDGSASPRQRSNDGSQEVVVTATRAPIFQSKVPVSISVLTRDDMDAQGIKSFTDIARDTPGLVLSPGLDGGGTSTISIRGVASNAGASTSGIYLDDVPLQVRQLGYYAGSQFPEVFDLDRVEVLRGPQGTLFGAGSEGGTVRFISPEASLKTYSVYARSEINTIEGGGTGGEVGVAVGGPLIKDELGFRISAYRRHEAGYIDRVPGTGVITDPTGATYGSSVKFTPSGPGNHDVNWSNATAFRAALSFSPTSSLRIKPSVFYQEHYYNDPTNEFSLSTSDVSGGKFSTPGFSAAAPTAENGLTQLLYPNTHHGRDSLTVAALPIEVDIPGATLTSTTSFLSQKKTFNIDSTLYYSTDYVSQDWPLPGQRANSHNDDEQRSFTQELRLQSSNPNAILKWVAGIFLSKLDQTSSEYLEENFFANADSYFGAPSLAGGDPFGAGSTNFQNTWGTPLLNQSGSYYGLAKTKERQSALFGQIDLKMTDRLTMTLGVRAAHDSLTFSQVALGPENNLNAPFGAACPTDGGCVYGQGAFAPSFPSGTVQTSENSVTPKAGLSFQADANNLLYLSAGKGFRPGGAQLPLPSQCASDLTSYGYVNGDGSARSPDRYKSDSLWSYEAGFKSRAFGGGLTVTGSAYVIKWKDIQSSLTMPTCGYSFVDNLTSATIKGFDLSTEVRPVQGLKLGASVAYVNANLDSALASPSGAIFDKGSALPDSGAPWTFIASAQYYLPFVSDLGSYVRVDATHSAAQRRSGQTDPAVFNYDPLLLVPKANTQVNLRFGLDGFDRAEVSFFINNLLNSHPLLSNQHYSGAPMWYATTLQPRTFGLNWTYRY